MEAVNEQGNLAYGMVMVQIWLYFNFISFYINLVHYKTGYNEPMQG